MRLPLRASFARTFAAVLGAAALLLAAPEAALAKKGCGKGYRSGYGYGQYYAGPAGYWAPPPPPRLQVILPLPPFPPLPFPPPFFWGPPAPPRHHYYRPAPHGYRGGYGYGRRVYYGAPHGHHRGGWDD